MKRERDSIVTMKVVHGNGEWWYTPFITDKSMNNNRRVGVCGHSSIEREREREQNGRLLPVTHQYGMKVLPPE